MIEQSPSPRRRLLLWTKLAAQFAILGLVAWGIWRTVVQAQGELSGSGVEFRNLRAGWLITAGLFYLLGMLPCGLFWQRVLLAMGQRPRCRDSLRAYFVSQPGKYVPGKFMGIVLRWTMLGQQVDFTVVAASSFVETLTMMSVGAVVGAFLLPVVFGFDWQFQTFAVCAAAVVGVPILPPVMRRVAKWTHIHRVHPDVARSLQALTIRGLAPGWGAIALGWMAMGVSFWAVLQASAGHLEREVRLADVPLFVACTALSGVAGFVSGLPGGVGTREWVAMELIKPHFGATAAVLSAVLHRCVIIGAELAASGLILAQRRNRATPDHPRIRAEGP